ncbi:hypothetical protein [Aquimarina rhabdastrellae]
MKTRILNLVLAVTIGACIISCTDKKATEKTTETKVETKVEEVKAKQENAIDEAEKRRLDSIRQVKEHGHAH